MPTTFQTRMDILTRRLWELADQGNFLPEASTSLLELLSAEPFMSAQARPDSDSLLPSGHSDGQPHALDAHRPLSSLLRSILRQSDLSDAARANLSRAWIAYEAACEQRRHDNRRFETS